MSESYDSRPHGGKDRPLGAPSGFRIIPNELFFRHLPRGRSYTEIEALLSLHLDIYQHGRLLSERAYSRVWRRTRPWAKARIGEFEADPEYQRQCQGVDQESCQRRYHESRGVTGACPDPRTTECATDRTSDLTTDRTTTLRQRQRTRQREQSAPSGAPHSLLDCVLEERSDWAPGQAGHWLKANLPRIEDSVDAQRPRDRDAAIRATVRGFARAERAQPTSKLPRIVSPASSEVTEPRSDQDRRALVVRRLKHTIGVPQPTEQQIRAHFEQFREFVGEYVPPPASDGIR